MRWLLLTLCACAAPAKPIPLDLHATTAAPAPAPAPEPPPPLPPPPPPPSYGPELAPSALGWPDDTRSLEVAVTIHVRREPRVDAPPAGKIIARTLTAWRRLVRTGDGCPAWVELDAGGWLCAQGLAPSPHEPAGEPQPVLPDDQELVPYAYAVVIPGARAYPSTDEVRAEKPTLDLPRKAILRVLQPLDIDGVLFQYTDRGYIRDTELRRLSPSPFTGLDLRTAPTSFPLGWAWPARKGATVEIREAPAVTARLLRRARRREILPLLDDGAVRDGWLRVGPSAWVARGSVRVARLRPPPPGADGGTWVDIDTDEQTLVAYQEGRPAFTTLVSSGGTRNPTPLGLYRVRAKAAITRMAALVGADDDYEVAAVPWAVRFRYGGLYLHAAYWHDQFGTRRSHGCINLSPRDARFLYEWVPPAVPPGWSEVEVAGDEGPMVRVFDAATPDPPVVDEAQAPPR